MARWEGVLRSGSSVSGRLSAAEAEVPHPRGDFSYRLLRHALGRGNARLARPTYLILSRRSCACGTGPRYWVDLGLSICARRSKTTPANPLRGRTCVRRMRASWIKHQLWPRTTCPFRAQPVRFVWNSLGRVRSAGVGFSEPLGARSLPRDANRHGSDSLLFSGAGRQFRQRTRWRCIPRCLAFAGCCFLAAEPRSRWGHGLVWGRTGAGCGSGSDRAFVVPLVPGTRPCAIT